jgi:UrcA family protein
MLFAKALSMCAAVGITTVGVLVMSPDHASARGRPIVVTSSSENLIVRRVSYADLNLASATGEKVLNRRVGSAVGSLCREATGSDTRSLNVSISMIRCSDQAWTGARPQIERALQRAHEIAATGSSAIAAVAITISLSE